MKIKTDKTGSIEEFLKLINTMENDNEVQAILILSCDANEFKKETLDPILQKIKKPLFGGIFPEIIFQTEKLKKGMILAGLTKPTDIYIIPNLSDMGIDYEEELDLKIPESSNAKTMFVFVDGFAHRISALIESLFNRFGLEMNYIGGGAGSLSFEQKPVLFTNKGLMQDTAILAMTNIESGVGVNHGWKDVAGPFKVTESDHNVIISLDNSPAFQIYREIVEKHSGKLFTENNFFEISKSYPFGISKLGTEKIVRDPITLGEKESLVCVGEVPEDGFVHILSGDSQSLIDAAEKALSLAKDNLNPHKTISTTFFIDCISRVLFLEDEFEKELKAVFDPSIPLIGALTLGEIANCGKDYLEFYNKTSVVGVLT